MNFNFINNFGTCLGNEKNIFQTTHLAKFVWFQQVDGI